MKDYNTKLFFLISSIIVSFFVIYLCDTPIEHVGGFLILVVSAIIISEYQVIHPYFWFSGIFALYSCSYPILYSMGFDLFTQITYTKETMLCQWLALTSFLLAFTPRNLEQYRTPENYEKTRYFSCSSLKVLHLLELVLFLFCLKLFASGYTSKKEIQAAGDIFFYSGERLAMIVDILFAYFVAVALANDIKLSKIKIEFVYSLVPIAAFILSTGDRSALFKYVFYLGIVLYTFKVIDKKRLIQLMPLGVAFMLLSNVFRYIAMGGGNGIESGYDMRGIVFDFLTSDFHCAARNLQVLINDPSTEGKFGLSLLFNDIIFVFFRGSGIISTSDWFNKTYFSGSIFGQAFTLVGEGYVMGGYLGIVVLFAVLGWLFKYLYKKSFKNLQWLIVFIVMAAGECFAFREMFMSVLSPLLRQCLPVFIIIYFFNRNSSNYFTLNKFKQNERL